jgi:predicted dehydrogenase
MIRWAVLGTGRFALSVLPKIQQAPRNTVVVLASRDGDRARAAAASLGLPESATCTLDDALLRDDVDAVYVALPNHLHVEWTRRALDASKHVLCEKPLCATRAEAESIMREADRARRLCVEGFMYMHHPQTARLIQLARPGGPLGRITRIRSHRIVRNTDPAILSTRLNHAMRGGALMDIGCYPLSLALLVMNDTPEWSTLRASADFARWIGDATSGAIEWSDGRTLPTGLPRIDRPSPHARFVDESCSFSLRFPAGALVEGECSFTKGAPAGASVFYEMIGDRGRAFTTHPFSPDPDRQVLTVEIDGRQREEIFEHAGDKFVNQFARFARTAERLEPPLPSPEFSILEADAIEHIHRAIGLTW